MSEIAKTIGQRVRNYRIEKGLSQEKLAELSGCHPTYIGQVERGEKNATLESIEKIASAMNISLAQLFEKIGESSTDSYPMKCYELVAAKSKSEQEHLYKMLVEMDKYKNQYKREKIRCYPKWVAPYFCFIINYFHNQNILKTTIFYVLEFIPFFTETP